MQNGDVRPNLVPMLYSLLTVYKIECSKTGGVEGLGTRLYKYISATQLLLTYEHFLEWCYPCQLHVSS